MIPPSYVWPVYVLPLRRCSWCGARAGFRARNRRFLLALFRYSKGWRSRLYCGGCGDSKHA